MTDGMDAKAVLFDLQAQDLLRAAWIEDSRDGRWNRFLLKEIHKEWIRIVNPTAAPDDDSGADLALLVAEDLTWASMSAVRSATSAKC